MGWKDDLRLAEIAFTEVALQATFALRQGNPLPPDPRALVPRARRRVAQSKALIAGLLVLLTLGATLLLRAGPGLRAHLAPSTMPAGLFDAAVLTGLLAVEIVLLWWNGLQALPTYLASTAVAVLEPLPLEPETVRRVALLVYLRLFDAPAAVVLVATPLAVGLSLGLLPGLLTVPASTSAVVFALALSLVTGRFFVRRVQGAGGGRAGTVVRWTLLVLWLLPVFGLLAFVTASPPILRGIAALSVGGSRPAELLAAVYPLTLALWPPLATGTLLAALPPAVPLIALLWTAIYLGLTAYAVVWLSGALAELGHLPPETPAASPVSALVLRPTAPARAVLTKDLRLASRTPGFAFLILLPLLDAVALGLVTYAGAPGASAARGVALGAVSAAALLATFFGPAFFALEVIAQSYGRTLPLAPRSMALGKVALVGMIYLAAGGIVLAITVARVPAPLLFAGFVAAELPAVLAAGLLEIGILYRWGRRRGLPVTNLYVGSWTVIAVAIPGLVLAGLPLLAYLSLGFVPMVLVALVELALAAPFSLGGGGA